MNAATTQHAEQKPANPFRFVVGGTGKGLLYIDTIKSSRRTDTACYLVDEFPTAWDGRAFHLKNAGGQSDKEADAYDVFVCRNGQDNQCSCKGFIYGKGKPCKHLTTLRTLIESGEL